MANNKELDKEKTPEGASSDSLRLNTINYSMIRQPLLDLLSQYQELEKPTNPELLKLFIEAAEDKISLCATSELQRFADEVEKVVGEKEFYNEHYPFVVTPEQHIEMKEKIARDDLRHDQHQSLSAIKKKWNLI